MPNLTPSEIAEITRKANLLFPESPQGYIAAACEYAAEIKRLREGVERIIDPIKYMRDNLKPGERLDKAYAVMLSEDAGYLQQIAKQLLNSQP